jgi:hypothetical protein
MAKTIKCHKPQCDLFRWLSPTHCIAGLNMIEFCKKQRKNHTKNVNKSNQSSPDTKGTDKV